MQVIELTGAALDWAVAKCEGLLDAGRVVVDFEYMSGHDPVRLNPLPDVYYSSAYSPSTDWAQGGPIIDRERIELRGDGDDGWLACDNLNPEQYGPTPLIAAMRCYVASKLGDDVQIPEELQ